MNKAIKIILSLIALVAVASTVFVFLSDWISTKKEKQTILEETTPAPLPTNPIPTDRDWLPQLKEISDEDKLTLAKPVAEKYFEAALLDEENAQVLSFYLDPNEPINAIFNGIVTEISYDQKPFPNDSPFDEITLTKEGGKMSASYVILGETLVKKGDVVSAGQILAKAGKGGLGFRSGTNLSLWVHDQDGEFIGLSKDMFQKE